MIRCGTHALVRWVTNEGVLTFRCFPSKSQLKNREKTQREENRVEFWACSLLQFTSRCSLRRIIIYTKPTRGRWYSVVPVTCRFCYKEQTKCLFHLRAQREEKQVWALHEDSTEAGRETSERHMRSVRDVCFVLVVVHVSKPPLCCVSTVVVP